MEKKITALPGDGIGPEIVSSAVQVLQAIAQKYNHTFHIAVGAIGGAAIHYHKKQLNYVRQVTRFY